MLTVLLDLLVFHDFFIFSHLALGAHRCDLQAGRCNQDFRLTGSDFQRLALKHYFEGDLLVVFEFA